MAENMLSFSNIFLSVICTFLIVISFLCNFTFLITLLKLRRLNNSDKSNYFLTHLIFADFFCAFFILVPSGYGVYNINGLGFFGCRVQVFFTTFFFSLTFHGLLALSIERFFKYLRPVQHINFFTNRQHQLNGSNIVTKSGLFTRIIIGAIWALNIFISFIPFFQNYTDVDYFVNESQCDYVYENFKWWLWLYFIFSIIGPFLGASIFFILTLRMIYKNAVIINDRLNKFRELNNLRPKVLSRWGFFVELFFPILYWNRLVVYENEMQNLREKNKKVKDTTRLPENILFYSHFIEEEANEGENEAMTNDMHLRKQLLVQFKYDTERTKVATFFYILLANFTLVFPVYAIHFYRTYTDDPTNFLVDETNAAGFRVYTTFVWISYFALIVKSVMCLMHNRFYRYSLYQAANCRGFHGTFGYEIEKIKKKVDKIEDKCCVIS